MDIEGGPVVNDVVVCRRYCDDPHFRMLAEQVIANRWPSAGLIERDNHKIRQSPLHTLHDFRIVNDLPDNFDVRLVREGGQDGLPHETRAVRHEDADGFFHEVLPWHKYRALWHLK